MKERFETTTVHLREVTLDGDDVWAVGTVEGVADAAGQPLLFRAHAWNSHLVTLPDDDTRRTYLAQQILIEARGHLPKDKLPLAGPVNLTLAEVQEALAPPAPPAEEGAA